MQSTKIQQDTPALSRLNREKELLISPIHEIKFPKTPLPELVYCSMEGLQKILQKRPSSNTTNNTNTTSNNNDNKNSLWCSEVDVELPIRLKESGPGSITPRSLIDVFQSTVRLMPQQPSLSWKKKGQVASSQIPDAGSSSNMKHKDCNNNNMNNGDSSNKSQSAECVQNKNNIDSAAKNSLNASSQIPHQQQQQWQTLTFQQEYDLCLDFAKSLIALNIPCGKAVNILGFNSAEWFISFFGSMFARVLPVGVYTTTQKEQCCYICAHSECAVVIVENQAQLAKYVESWTAQPAFLQQQQQQQSQKYRQPQSQTSEKQQQQTPNSRNKSLLPDLQYIVIYDDSKPAPSSLPPDIRDRVFLWEEFLALGKAEKAPQQQKKEFAPVLEASSDNEQQRIQQELETRMRQIKPGHCCSLVYTSGTTGPPKGAMLSHDNYFWEGAQLPKYLTLQNPMKGEIRQLSYLPLSHIAAQLFDLIANVQYGAHIYFADPSALQNNLIQFLREVRPTWFFAVPRVWEKLEISIKQSGLVSGELAKWAMSVGVQGTEIEEHQPNNNINNNKNSVSTTNRQLLQKLPQNWALAKEKVFNPVKEYIGLDQAMSFSFSAAPMQVKTRLFFLQLNMNLLQCYGMTEMAGPQFYQTALHSDVFDEHYLRSTGRGQDGTDVKLKKVDNEGKGNICYRGRNRFMGYFKDDKKTMEAIDEEGYIDSGDIGVLDEFGNLEITGRAKELIITSGGENVPPVLIEDVVKQELKCVNNCMLIGDNRKFLSLLICLRQEVGKAGKIKKQLAKDVIEEFKLLGSTARTVGEAKKCQKVLQYLQEGVARANKQAASKAQYIQKWVILDKDFSVEGGELTSTMKLQRKVTENKYKGIIDAMYVEPKL